MRPLLHELASLSRFVGLRDRLRCPRCRSVGTWKPHGGWFDFEDDRKVRRWLCKWCGLYRGPEGEKQAVVAGRGFWELEEDATGETTTPQRLCGDIWPWRG